MPGRSRVLRLGLTATLLFCLAAEVAQGKLTTRTFSSGNVNRAIPDKAGLSETFIASPIIVKAWGKVRSVQVGVRITHPAPGELSLAASNPAVKESKLVDRAQGPAGGGPDFGAGAPTCTGSVLTTFSDLAPTSILQGVSPFAGSFRPLTPLTALRGGQLRGKWFLEIGDLVAGNAGVLNCWQVRIRYRPQAPPRGPKSKGDRPPKTIKT